MLLLPCTNVGINPARVKMPRKLRCHARIFGKRKKYRQHQKLNRNLARKVRKQIHPSIDGTITLNLHFMKQHCFFSSLRCGLLCTSIFEYRVCCSPCSPWFDAHDEIGPENWTIFKKGGLHRSHRLSVYLLRPANWEKSRAQDFKANLFILLKSW